MGERVPALSSKKLVKKLLQFGFIIIPGGKGSHTKLFDPRTHQPIVIPKNEHLGVGLRTKLIKDLEKLGISRHDIFRYIVGLLANWVYKY